MKKTVFLFETRYLLIMQIIGICLCLMIVKMYSLSTSDGGIGLDKKIIVLLLEDLFTKGFIFLVIIYGFRYLGIKFAHVIGKFSYDFRSSWLKLLIIFVALEYFEDALSDLGIFAIHAINSDGLRLIVGKSTISELSQSTPNSLLKILFYLVRFISSVVIAPLIEEFIFRGVLLNRFFSKWGATPAILLSSLLFGLIHINLFNAVIIGTTSIVYSLLYVRTKTLIIPIIFHALHNGIIVFEKIGKDLFGWNKIIPTYTANSYYSQQLDNGLVYLVISLPILFYFCKWPNSSVLSPYAANLERDLKKAED